MEANNKKKYIPVKCRIMTIVHGKSELVLCEHIKSNLKIKEEIVSERNGNYSMYSSTNTIRP
jgi:hypothetical protein